jgi:hypothetical protein
MDSELKLYQQVKAKLDKHPRDVQVRTLQWVASKLHEEHEAKTTAVEPPPAE